MGETITIKSEDGDFGAYLARPEKVEGRTQTPAVVVIQEIFGVNQVMRDVCDDLASAGFLAVCPDLFWRIEPSIDITDKSEAEWKKAFELYNAFDVEAGVKDIAATIDQVRGMAEVNGKVGAVGYCLGGLLAFLTATRTDSDATVSYYGIGIEKHLVETEKQSHPLLMHVAEEDQFVPTEARALIVATLKNHPQIELHTYPGRDHAFARKGGEHYDAADAKLADGRSLTFFKQHLGGVMTALMKAVQFEATGGPEVLKIVEIPVPTVGPGQVLVRQEAIGINFIDTYHRSGLYPVKLPSRIGMEGAGVVEAVGDGVTRFKTGDRIASASGPIGAYAEFHVVNAERAIRLPEGIDAPTAAAALLKGMTAEFLLRRTYPVKAGETILVHAAAGGVGSILVQWAKHLGAVVIGTAGSEEKAERVRGLGADHVILYRDQDVAAEVRKITGGAGVPVAYDFVGAATFEGTLGSLARRGLFVSFGNASGPVPPFAPSRLQQAGSLFFTRPTMGDYQATTAELDESAAALFAVIKSGAVRIDIGQTFRLTQARTAHEALEGRETVGASLLIP